MKNFLKKNMKRLGKVALILASLVALSFAAMLILSAFDIIYIDDGIKINAHLFDQFKNSWYGWLIVILIQIVITTVLCFIPGASMAFILLLTALYPIQWQAFLISFIGVMTSSFLMYFTGRIGGYPICKKLLGEKDCEKASDLLNNRGVVFFPVMMLFPIFPDDALTMIAGTLKMSLKWFVPSIVVGRSVGIATIVFGLGNIPFDKFTTVWHWLGFFFICAAGIVLVFFLANKLSLYLEKRNQENAAKEPSAEEREEAPVEKEAPVEAAVTTDTTSD